MNVFAGYSLKWDGSTGSYNGFPLDTKPDLGIIYDQLDTDAMNKVVNGLTTPLEWDDIKKIIAFIENRSGAAIRLPGILPDGTFVWSERASNLIATTPFVPASLNGEKWVWQDGTWVDGRTSEDLAKQLEEAKKKAKQKIADLADSIAVQITGIVPLTEQLSWSVKETAAIAFQNNTATPVQLALLSAEAQVTGEQVADLAEKVVANAMAYHSAAGMIAGQRRKASELIDQATDLVEVASTLQLVLEQCETIFEQMLMQA